MTRGQWFLSAFLVCYVASLVLNSLPTPADLLEIRSRDSAPPAPHPLAQAVDALAFQTMALHRSVWQVVEPLATAAATTTGMTGVPQRWNMFTNPPRGNEYLRLRYYVTPSDRPAWTAVELVFPANREDRVQLFDGFTRSFLNKALAKATDGYLVARERLIRERGFNRDADREALLAAISRHPPGSYVPVVRYFSRRFAAVNVPADARLTRVEVWYGFAPLAPAGQRVSTAQLLDRHTVLDRYYGGPRREPTIGAYPPYGAVEREADIAWNLFYTEERR